MGQTSYRRFALDLGWAYEEQMNDELNGSKLIDNIDKYLKSLSAYDVETRKMQNNLNSLTANILSGEDGLTSLLAKAAAEIDDETERAINSLEDELNVTIKGPEIDLSGIKNANDEMDQYLAETNAKIEEVAELNQILEDAIIQSASSGVQALTDMIMGIEGADASQVLSALLQPFANTMIQLGEMLIVEGLAISAFQESLRSLRPEVALAAGATLLVVGAALSSGIKSLATSTTGTTASSGAAASATSSTDIKTYNQELTVNVVGEISGDKIVLAGQKTLNKWSR